MQSKRRIAVAITVLAAAVQIPAQTSQPGGGRARSAAPATGVSPAFPQRPPADPASVDRGKALYGVNCNFCHGSDARGGEGGPNLLRSQLVLEDKNGELIAPVVTKGRVDLGMPAFANITAAQTADLAAYIHTFPVLNRDPARFPPPSILVGNAKDGEAYFRAKCASCHSATGDLKGIASKITDPKTLQNTFVMPGGGGRGSAGIASATPVTATVTPPAGHKVEGRLLRIDDFWVTLVDADGAQRSFRRDGGRPNVEIHDPLAPHRELLAVYTDKDIHNLTAYLVTFK
jgi:cytochrome c oxidase cbb3-type subunit 3